MKNIKLSNKELCEKYPFLLPYHAISQQDSLFSALLGWLDSNGEVVYSDGLSENEGLFASQYGFAVIDVEKLNNNIEYYALFRKTSKGS